MDEAIEAVNKAIALEPKHAEAYYNMGIILQEGLQLEDAMKAYKKAFSIKPDLAEAEENFWALKTQLRQTMLNIADKENQLVLPDSSKVCRPKYQIYQAIYNFLRADQNMVSKQLKWFENRNQEITSQLTHKEQIFCSGYYDF